MKNLVKLPSGAWVNPQQVLCIELADNKTETELWLCAPASYDKGPFTFEGNQMDFIARIINGDDAEEPSATTEQQSIDAVNTRDTV